MEQDQDIILLTGDLGFRAFEPVQAKFPERFINVGIAEANMIGVAAGLALTGKKPIAYSIASFATMRCYEQIRTDVCYHDLNVKIVGVGGGYNYAHQGVTHHTVEDLAIMRVLPSMSVICPSNSWEAREATKAICHEQGPTYLRLGKSPGVDYNRPDWSFAIGKGFIIKDGTDILLICTGNTLTQVLEAAQKTEAALGKSVCVISMPSVKPLDTTLLLEKAVQARGIFTIEEHSTIGGLGSAVGDALIASSLPKKIFFPFGFPDRFIKDVGSREYLLSCAGLDADSINRQIVRSMSIA